MTTRVLIAVPALDLCATDFALSLAALMGHTTRDSLRREIAPSLWCQKGSIIMDARNAAIDAALSVDASHILFLDSDMVFPKDTLARLLEHKKDIVGATYVRRYPPHEMLGDFENTTPGGINLIEGKSLVKTLSLPFGCILIKMQALTKLHRPYFRYLTTEGGTISEDEWFCLQAREAGLTVWCDLALTAEVGHIGQAIYRSPQ